MSFLSPLFLLGMAAAALPVVLHLLKRHPDVHVKFAAVRFLQHAPVEHARHRHLRELLLLALRVAALLLLAAAFARPFFAASAASSGDDTVVVALDVSMSMSAPGAFDRARALATTAVNASRTASVVTFADDASVASRPSTDHALAVDAIARATPGSGATRYRAAVSTVAELLRGSGGRVIVVTDLQQNGWEAGDRVVVPPGVRVEVADVDASAPNLAITDLRADAGRLLATIVNTGDAAKDVVVSVQGFTDVAKTPSGSARETRLALDGHQTVETALPVPAGRWASVSVADPGGIGGDDVRYIVLDRTAEAGVLVVTTNGDLEHDALYVGRALNASAQGATALVATGVSGSALGSWDEQRLDRAAAVLLLSTRGLEHRARQLLSGYVQRGGGLLVALGPSVDVDVLLESVGGLRLRATPDDKGGAKTIGDVDSRHPIMREFVGPSSLGAATFRRTTSLRAEGCDVLATFTSSDPALLECEAGKGHVLLFASDLNNEGNDFPRRATFLPFLHEAVRHLSSAQRADNYVIGRMPKEIPANPGVVETSAAGGTQLVAVNVDPAEAAAERIDIDQFLVAIAEDSRPVDTIRRATNADVEARQHAWQYILAAMTLVLAVESAVAAKVG